MKKTASSFRDSNYYHIAHAGSNDLTHPGLKILIEYAKNSKNILDLGCGEGTRVNKLKEVLNNDKIKFNGIDINDYAIKLAKKQFPKIYFFKGDLETLPFKDASFDLCFSAFVFEHLTNPEQVLKEAHRVLIPGGRLMILAPNFGAPNRRSPNSLENKFKKLLVGWKDDYKENHKTSLKWKLVEPQHETYIIDADATIEPYLNSLNKYAKTNDWDVDYTSSFWDIDRLSLFQLFFRILGTIGVYPFKNWGPHLGVVLKKR